MGNTMEYSCDVQQKVVELHRMASGFKKIAQASKMPTSTIREIIKKFWVTRNRKLFNHDFLFHRGINMR